MFCNICIYSTTVHAGPDGIVIVDTTESCDVARYLFSQFQEKFSKKPLKAIILTHFHTGLFQLINKKLFFEIFVVFLNS